ncbi:MAG: MBL fold metallo-hydrolase [Methylobacterium sp.]|nr:MBL fold metallo-hydrolase [Methylobacterium sp.]MCA3637575.1 MBL fold metallo-hydrolase [Methylobacterium sp.]
MTTRRNVLTSAKAAGALLALGPAAVTASTSARAQETKAPGPSWHSQSLTTETVTGPNGSITTPTALSVNPRMGMTETKIAEPVAPGVYALRGWGIAHSFAIEAPNGWIIVDTGNSTQAAAEMRETLERAVGKKIKVAAILLTHWHYADGTAAWLDEGTEIWGHEHLDRNRIASGSIGVIGGYLLSRATAQFGVFHPTTGPDAFPNALSFTPDKFLLVSSYKPPTKLFPDGKVIDVVIAGEPIEVAPCRTDVMDSVAFYFPQRRLMVTNFLVIETIFNIYTLRGGAFRNPEVLVSDTRWVESKNAEILLDIHNQTLRGEKVVREALERSIDSVQLIHDQALRLIASGLGPREAAEALYMPRNLRRSREGYGQVESHVRQIYNGNIGWFDGDVYDINPLSVKEEAERTVEAMGGRAAVQKMATRAVADGGLANWRWALKLTSLLLKLDPTDATARQARTTAARALGQRTDSSNARGFYITEALQMEGKLLVQEQPQTMDGIRKFLSTPRAERLTAVSAEQNLQFVRYLVDPRKAEGQRLVFTLAAEGDPQIRRVELRNSVLVISNTDAKAAAHVDLTRSELANFVLGKGAPAKAGDALTELDRVLDRSRLMPPTTPIPAVLDAKGDLKYNDGLQH